MFDDLYLEMLEYKAQLWCVLGNQEDDPRWKDVCFYNADLLRERIMHILDVLGW